MMRPFHREGEGSLNESPSQKEGKSGHAGVSGDVYGGLNESPSQKEGKSATTAPPQ